MPEVLIELDWGFEGAACQTTPVLYCHGEEGKRRLTAQEIQAVWPLLNEENLVRIERRTGGRPWRQRTRIFYRLPCRAIEG